jgi:3-oxoacyl-[acyl-carrier protein] reductase
MTGRVEGKVAVVIGGPRGIGAAIALRLIEEGASVVVADSLEAEGRATAERLSQQGEAVFVATDVSRKESVDALVEATLSRFGQVDILVQNAGIYPYTMLPGCAGTRMRR